MKEKIIRDGLSLNHLLEYLNQDEGIKAAVVNAVHRFYYDYCFSPYTERPYNTEACRQISTIHTNLQLKNPMWRITLNKLGYMVNYNSCEPKELPTSETVETSFTVNPAIRP